MVDSGLWHQATVRDRNDQTVHVGNVTGERDQRPGNDHLPPGVTTSGPGRGARRPDNGRGRAALPTTCFPRLPLPVPHFLPGKETE
jgi:hypothetical protein